MFEKMRWLAVSLALSILVLTGCEKPPADGAAKANSSGSAAAASTSSLSGAINIEGSSTVEPISIKAREKFSALHPKVNISVSGQGTSNGYAALGRKECEVCDASRPIKASELKTLADNKVGFYEIPVAYDGLTIVVNKKNDFVKELTIEQITKIFREDTAAKTWKEVNDAWPDKPISIFAPGIKSGTHDYFVEVIGKKDDKGMRADEQTTLSEDDKTLVIGVRDSEFAIGFFGYAYYEASKDDLKAVPIVNPETNKPVTPSFATIESGEYFPFSRPLFIVVQAEAYQRGEVREFVDFYLEHASELAKAASYVPLPDAIYQMARDHIDQQIQGTHYLDAKGNSREGKLADLYTPDNVVTK